MMASNVAVAGILEPVHCFTFYKNCVLSASTANKIGVHSLQPGKVSLSVRRSLAAAGQGQS